MKVKGMICAFILCIVCVILFFVVKVKYNQKSGLNKNSNENIKYTLNDDYIAIFNGGSGEQIYKTYVFKDNKYYYINVTSTTESWGSTKRKDVITSKGSAKNMDEIFKIASENNAFSYVMLPDNDGPYSIETYSLSPYN